MISDPIPGAADIIDVIENATANLQLIRYPFFSHSPPLVSVSLRTSYCRHCSTNSEETLCKEVGKRTDYKDISEAGCGKMGNMGCNQFVQRS